jgi:hypothetical protein
MPEYKTGLGPFLGCVGLLAVILILYFVINGILKYFAHTSP